MLDNCDIGAVALEVRLTPFDKRGGGLAVRHMGFARLHRGIDHQGNVGRVLSSCVGELLIGIDRVFGEVLSLLEKGLGCTLA
jgi:hypothetical protein